MNIDSDQRAFFSFLLSQALNQRIDRERFQPVNKRGKLKHFHHGSARILSKG